MKAMILSILYSALASTHAYAGLLGPSNYEECVADIVKSGNNSNYAVALTVCRSQYPKLINLSKKRNVALACEDVLGKWIYHLTVQNKTVTVRQLGNVKFEITSFTNEGITFKGSSQEKENKREVLIYGKVNAITSDGSLIVEYMDKKSTDFTYTFSCTEEN